MFKKLSYIILLTVLGQIVFAQEFISSMNIADLSGAIEIEREGKYEIEFPGYGGEVKDFKNTDIVNQFKEKNSIFLIKRCLTKDEMVFDIEYEKPYLQLLVYKFKYQSDKSKLDINEMEMVYISTEPQNKYSNLDESDYRLPDFECNKDDAFLIVINSIKRNFGIVKINFIERIKDPKELLASRTKIFDDRLPDDESSLVIKMIDEETLLPIICSINLSSKKKSLLYNASEVILGQDTRGKIQIQCDAEGYFFKDTLIKTSEQLHDTIEIELKSVSVGKVFKIDKIEFNRGTANIVSSAEKVLRRVKDFLVLNSEVNIEIQGHVNNEGAKDDKKSMKLSKLRAKTIRDYFRGSGINKDRMKIKGYGNTMPVYPNPKNEFEQQANRRVEIKILK